MEYINFEHNETAAELVRAAYDTPPLAFVHSYGCQRNVNDGERIKGVLTAEDTVSRIYINFCDPWPSNRHAKRRLTHPDFLLRYRQVLAEAGEIHFKTDNRDLFEWSLFQFPRVGFGVSEVTRDLHADGIHGVMTDYEEKFHNLGTPINRCVGTMGPLPEVPEPPAEE